MGVYHLMGLGLSAGAVTGPISYLGHRYQRWNTEDKNFFSRSGELVQRRAGEKVGDIQAIVVFTTPEVIKGKDELTNKPFYAFEYADNPPGKIVERKEQPRQTMQNALHKLLKREWKNISGGRQSGELLWCEINRRDIRSTYERIIQVIAALSGVGGQGKEMWVNLTGGTNVTNFALQLAATLSGDVARMYYVQAENPMAEKCIRFTNEMNYWIELPVLPLVLNDVNIAVLDILEKQGNSISDSDIFGRLQTHSSYWNLVQGTVFEDFKTSSLVPLWKQGLIAEENNGYITGSQWKLIKPYQEILQKARSTHLSIEQLAEKEDWIKRDKIQLL